ncbi:MAG: type IV pilus modification protein PilV [Woeseiaceae bacterium]
MISTKNRTGDVKHGRGFSLIEVLIALIILSVGMLGIAGLYVQSMQAGRTSMFRHNAVTIAGDIADRIRANPAAGTAYTAAVGADKSCVNGGVDCLPADMAAHDIYLWQEQADDSLPNGKVTVTHDGDLVLPSYEIKVEWDEPGESPTFTIVIPVLDI